MTALAQTATDFARECLGWEDVREDGIGLYVYSHPERPKKLLHYGDLSAVMNIVRRWCDRSGCRVELHYSPEQNGFGVLCEGVDTWNIDPCHALMAACVQAARKLK